MVPWDELNKDPLTIEYGQQKNTLLEWIINDRRVVCYPCDNHQTANFAAFLPTAEVETEKHGILPFGLHPE
jgi:hypothetical protein